MTLSKPDYFSLDEYEIRLNKLKEIRNLGIDPYPHSFSPTDDAKALHARYPAGSLGHSEEAAEGKTAPAKIAGRLVLFRAMGKNAFGHLQDHSSRLQVMFNKELTMVEGLPPPAAGETSQEHLTPLKFIEKKIDLGDILGIEGHLFFTNKGELTLFAKKVSLLSKTLLPLADKHGGLADKELRYRKRWLDLISRSDVKELFEKRSRLFQMIRTFMHSKDFIEVETPVLQSIYGGAEARPFKTLLNALEQEMFMRISLEIPLKKLIVGGMQRIFEIGRVFRNEGIDRHHNPEFTMLEAYAAWWDYNDMMSLVETLFETLALGLYGSTKVPAHFPGTEEKIELEMKAPWPRVPMKEAIAQFGKIEVDSLSDEQMKKLLLESGHCAPEKLKTMSRGLLIAALFEVFAEPHLIQPHHIIDHPIETTPLCKPHRNGKQKSEGLVERFESFILGHEICNAYTELNDPEIQRKLLEQQALRREAGDEEANPLDEEFLEAICQGMPPTGGVGIGLDRLVMIMTDSHSIRDVLYFPWMKPVK